MKIENGAGSNIPQLDALQKKTPTPAVREAAPPSKKSDEAFSVELSKEAGQLNNSQSTEEINRDRVAAIRDQLAAGTYNISGKDVANKILGVLK